MSLLFRLAKTVVSNPVVARNLTQRASWTCGGTGHVALGIQQLQPRVFMSSQVSSEHNHQQHEVEGAQAPEVISQSVKAPSATISNASNLLRTLERSFAAFEERCQRQERVAEKDFIRTFNVFTKAIQTINEQNLADEDIHPNIVMFSTSLIRCCGNLMIDVPPKGRELLAGNLWTFLKENNVPLDISHYNSLIRVLNENETNFDPKTILEEINERQLKPDRVTYQRMIHQYCLQGDISGATGLLETMKDQNMELTEATFASLILGYCKQDKPPAVTEVFDLMRSNGVEPGSRSYAAAFTAQAGRIAKDPEGGAAEFAKVVELMEKDEIQFSINEMVDLITHVAPHRKSHESVERFFELTMCALSGSATSRYRVLAAFMRVNQLEEASKLFWTQTMSDKARLSGNVGLYYIRALASHYNVPADFAITECQKMRESGWNLKAMHLLYYNAAENGRLDVVRAAMKKIVEDEPMKAHYTWPLIAQAKTEDDIIEVLKNDLNPQMDSADLLETFSNWVWPRFVDNAQKLFDLMKELKYDNHLLMASFLNYSVQEDKIVEAIKFITEAPGDIIGDGDAKDAAAEGDNLDEDADGEGMPMRRGRYNNDRSSLVERLLNQIMDQTKDPELVKKAFEMCKMPAQQVSLRALGTLVKVHLANNDFNSALEEFLRISKEYRLTPCRAELMTHCLVNKDPDNLQKIMNTVTELFGESNSLFDLAICCLKTNKLKQAQKIFASPGFRVRPTRVYQTCRSLARSGNVSILENFVSLTRDMYDINQEYLYQILLDTYEQTSNAKRALHLWNMMQEEEFQPSKKSLIMIANILERNNIDVPFQKPKLSYQMDRGRGQQPRSMRVNDSPVDRM